MRIAIDMQGYQSDFSRHRGVGRYTKNIIAHIIRAAQKKEHEIILLLSGAFPETIEKIRAEFGRLLPQKDIKVWQQFYRTAATLPQNSFLTYTAKLIREEFIYNQEIDIIFSTNLQEGIFDSAITSVKEFHKDIIYASVLHDIIPLSYSDIYLTDDITKTWYLEKIQYIKQSDIIFTVSEYSKKEIIEKLNISSDRIFITYNAVDPNIFKVLPDESSEERVNFFHKIGLKKSFILYAGGADYHKNLNRLYEAYSTLPESTRIEYDLVLVGKELKLSQPQVQSTLRKLQIIDNVHYLGFVEDEDLIKLYNYCSVFVYPSLREGFGIPPLEAMACGATVICSNTTSLPEVISFPDALFDPENVTDIKQKLYMALTDLSFRDKFNKFAAMQLEKFSWEHGANQIIEAFENAISTIEDRILIKERLSPIRTIIDSLNHTTCSDSISDQDLKRIAYSISETFPIEIQHPRLFIDISSIIQHDDKSGIQRVVRALTERITSITPQDTELIYSTPGSDFFYSANFYLHKTLNKHEIVEFSPQDTLLFLDLHPALAISLKQKIFYLRNKGVNVYHIIYDLIPINYPDMFWPELVSEFNDWLKCISLSDGVICISKSVANEYIDWLAENPPVRQRPFGVAYFHLGADIENSVPSTGVPSDAETILKKLTNRITFLMVGTLEPRKGHKLILAAMENLWSEGVDVNLLFVGRAGWGVSELCEYILKHPRFNDRLFWLTGVSDEYLNLIYDASSCVIAASKAEGFGLPLIEAAKKGLPIIANDIAVFREVAGNHAFYFQSDNALDVANDLKNWLQLYQDGNHPRSSGLTWLTWQESAEQLLQIIHNNSWYTTIDYYEN